MVQFLNSSVDGHGPEKLAVKLEIEDPLDEEHGPIHKRPREWSAESSTDLSQPATYNPLDEPSPLGLRLRKSPSLLDLIQMRLSLGSSSTGMTDANNLEPEQKKDIRFSGTAASSDKLKASNFPASLLRIGTWERVSRYEGDLVAKCYFAKHKLVWEVLEGGLKSKIEIQWSDITAITAHCPENGPGTLDIVLSRQPLFFRETNPQPRKHTLWQATSDFTSGQASTQRRHFLQCPQGILNKHFEKLIQCDPRLNLLSRQPEIVLESPYFETKASVFEDPDETMCHSFDNLKSEYVSTFSDFQNGAYHSLPLSSPNVSEMHGMVKRTPDPVYKGLPSPSSVMDSRAIDESGNKAADDLKGLAPTKWDQFKMPELRPSMSMNDLVSHIGQCISEQVTSGSSFFVPEGEGSRSRDLFEEISQYLLCDSQLSSTSDEKSLMSRVNSLCSLLQKDEATIQQLHIKNEEGTIEEPNLILNSHGEMAGRDISAFKGDLRDETCGFKQQQPSTMSRKDSVGDLLLHLPRITSLPQFLLSISEDGANQAR